MHSFSCFVSSKKSLFEFVLEECNDEKVKFRKSRHFSTTVNCSANQIFNYIFTNYMLRNLRGEMIYLMLPTKQ